MSSTKAVVTSCSISLGKSDPNKVDFGKPHGVPGSAISQPFADLAGDLSSASGFVHVSLRENEFLFYFIQTGVREELCEEGEPLPAQQGGL